MNFSMARESELSLLMNELRAAVENLEKSSKKSAGEVKVCAVEDPFEALGQMVILGIVSSEELLRRTEARGGDGLHLSWNSTGVANRLGYCQHATPLWDRHHLSHHNNGQDFSMH